MANYTEENRQLHFKAIKQIMAIKPKASLYVISDQLKRVGLGLTTNYIAKIRAKIIEERMKVFRTANVEKRIAEMQEKAELVQDNLFPVLLDPRTPVKDKVRAAKTIMDIEVDLFNSQMDAGMFERKLGELGLKHDIQLEPEDKKQIVDAFINMGLIKAKPTEAKVIEAEVR